MQSRSSTTASKSSAFRRSDPSRDEARREIGIPAGALVVGSVGRLHPDKNHQLLLRAAARLRSQGVDVFVVIVGDGPERAALATLAEDLGVSGHATFLGERTDVERILPAFDAFALPSKTEGTPVTLLEAMAARVPIVAAAVGGIPEMLQDGRDACLVTLEGGDAVAELAAALFAVLSDRSLAHETAERAFARVQRDFSAPAIFQRYLELYREVVEAGSVGSSSSRLGRQEARGELVAARGLRVSDGLRSISRRIVWRGHPFRRRAAPDPSQPGENVRSLLATRRGQNHQDRAGKSADRSQGQERERARYRSRGSSTTEQHSLRFPA